MGRARQQFSAAAPRCSHGAQNFRPAEDFEAHTGLRGIAGHYRFPHNMSATTYQTRLEAYSGSTCFSTAPSPEDAAAIRKEWETMVRLNPGLANVRLDKKSSAEILNALLGAASQFNADDINFFLLHQRRGDQAEDKIEALKKSLRQLMHIRMAVELTAGARMEWIPSPQTLQKARAALEERTGQPIEWILSAESRQHVRDILAARWLDPKDTPEQTAATQEILRHEPFGDSFGGLYRRLYGQEIEAVREGMLKDIKKSKRFPKREPFPTH